MMNEKLDWTQKLGTPSWPRKRRDDRPAAAGKAYAAGNLKTTPEQKVVVEQAPAQHCRAAAAADHRDPVAEPPGGVRASYNPTVVYGTWPYRPIRPTPITRRGMAGASLLSFGVGMAVGAAIWGNCNWGGKRQHECQSVQQLQQVERSEQQLAAQHREPKGVLSGPGHGPKVRPGHSPGRTREEHRGAARWPAAAGQADSTGIGRGPGAERIAGRPGAEPAPTGAEHVLTPAGPAAGKASGAVVSPV
jgi:hypothetical protein